VTYVKLGVEASANSALHQTEQEIRILATPKLCTGSGPKGLIETQGHPFCRSANEKATCAGSPEDVDPSQVTFRLKPMIPALEPMFIPAA
jgi:hypothetical protein